MTAELRRQIHDLIIGWLEKDGKYSAKELPNQQGFYHMILAEYREDPTSEDFVSVSIQFPTAREDTFQITASVSISKLSLDVLKTWTEKKWAEVIWDITILLSASNCSFKTFKKDNGFIQRIMVWEDVYFDGCSRDRFMQAIRRVLNCHSLIIFMFQKHAGEPRPKSNSNVAIQ